MNPDNLNNMRYSREMTRQKTFYATSSASKGSDISDIPVSAISNTEHLVMLTALNSSQLWQDILLCNFVVYDYGKIGFRVIQPAIFQDDYRLWTCCCYIVPLFRVMERLFAVICFRSFISVIYSTYNIRIKSHI